MLSQSRSWYVRFLGQGNKRRRQHSLGASQKYRRRAFLEALESRQVLTAPLPVDLPPEAPTFPVPQPDNPGAQVREGWLYISAAFSPAHNNQLTISRDDAGTIFIRDEELLWNGTGGIEGAQLSSDGQTLIIPEGIITGQQILVNGGEGNDNLIVDFSGGNPIPLRGVKFNGLGQTSARGDEITFSTGEVESVDYVFINENDGSITIDGRTLDYVGLEPVTDNLSATTRSFTFTGPAETITVMDGAADGMTEIDSDLAGEVVNFFSSPTTSLTIVTNGGDTTNITSFDPGFSAPLLSLVGTTTNNTFNLGASNVIPDATTLSLTGNVVFSLNGNNEQIGSLASTDATPIVGLTTGQVLTVGGSTTSTFTGTLTGAGGLTRTGTGTQILSGTGPTYTGPNTVNSGVLRITQANAAGTGTTTISSGGAFEINNITHNAAVALNAGGILRGLGASARENGIITMAAGVGVTLAATAGSTLTLGNGANDLTGGAGSTITVDGGGIVAQTQSSNAGAAANPVRWNVINGSSLQISTDAQFGTVPAPAVTNFLTLDNGTLRNATTASITMNAARGITLGAGGATIRNTTGTNITYAGLFTAPVPVPLNVVGPGNGALILTGPASPNQFSALNIDDTRFYVSGTSANAVGAATVPINVTNSGQFGYLNSASSITIPNPITMASGTTMVSRAVTTFSLTLSGVVTLPTSGTIIFNNEATANGLINFTGPNTGANALNLTGDLTIQVGENTAGTAGDAGQVNLNHEINGPFGVIKTEEGTLQLSGASTYTGVTTIQEGILNATTIGNYGEASSIGARTLAQETATGNGIGLRFTGGTLQYTGTAAESTDRQIRVSTAGGTIDSSGTGTLSFTHSGANINWFDTPGARTLTLTGTNTGLNVFANQIHNQAAGTGLSNVTKTGAGRWQLNNAASTYTGITSFSGGILNSTGFADYGLPSPLGARTLAEESATGDDIGLVFRSGTLQYTGSTAQSTNRQIRVQNTGGAIDASGTGAGTLSFTHSGPNINWFDTTGTRTFTLTGTNTGLNTFAQQITNQGANATSLTKTAAGLWVLSNTGHTYTGTTTVSAGILAVTGTIVGPTVVQNTGALGGGGTTGTVTVNAGGIHAPGNLVGSATVVGNYVENGRLLMEIGSPSGNTAGVDYDQLLVTGSGSVSISPTASLTVTYTGTAGTFAPPLGQIYKIVDNDGTAPADTAGLFTGLPEGAVVTVDGKSLAISYIGGDGNDITLTAVPTVPIVYIDDDFVSGSVDGDSETAGVQAATVGVDAFASIAVALSTLPANFSGIMVVNGGTYASADLAAGTGNITLRLVQDLVAPTANNVTIQNLTGSAGDTIVTRYFNAANANLTVEQGNFAGVISGIGTVTKTTAGTLTLSGVSTYAGATALSAGTITTGVNNALPPATALTLGSGATVGTLNLATFNQTIGSLTVGTNSASDNVITIGAGRTLTVNGNVTVSNNTATSATNLLMNGGGALDVNGTNFIVGSNSTAAPSGNTAKLDASALALVDLTMTGAITIQADGDNLPAAFSQLILSNTANILRAPTLTVGASSTAGTNLLTLGTGTNVINVNTFNIGTGGRDAGNVSFAGAGGSIVVRNQAGTGRATFNLGTGTSATGIGATNTFNVGGHNADLLLGAVNIGTQPRSATWTSTFTFDTGTLDMTSLELATTTQTAESGNGASLARITNATVNLGGGTVTIGSGILSMGEIMGTDYTVVARPHTMNAVVNISGGTVNIGATAGVSITMATLSVTGTNTAALASNATLNITGGVTTLAGSIVRGALSGSSSGGFAATATVNIASGTLNVVGPIGSAALSIPVNKTTAGTATLSGNTFAGATTVSGGIFNLTGNTSALTVAPGATLVPNPAGAVLITAAGNYAQNGPLNMEIAHATNDVAGTDYDQIKVTGTVTLGGALSMGYTGVGAFTPTTGQLYTLIDNDGTTDPVSGIFSGFPEGFVFPVGTVNMRISYVGGDGNDVTLSIATGVPAIIYIDDNFPVSGAVADANLELAGNQPATMGTDAFQTIADALSTYSNYSGNLFVNAGTYAAALALGGSVTLRLLQDVTLTNLTGDANDTIITRALGTANGNLSVEQGSFAGLITGAGNLTKSSAGTLTLSRANNYTGSTNIADGTLQLGIDNALPTGTAVSIGGLGSPVVPTPVTTTATFNLGAFSQTLASLNSTANSTVPNVVTIGAGETLTLTAGMSLGLGSTNAVTGSPPTDTVLHVNGAGTLSISGTTINVGVNSTGTNFSHESHAVLDVSALGAFNVNVTNFNVGVGVNTVPQGTLNLSNTANTILATNFTISDTAGSNGNGTVVVTLGTGTNVLQVNTLTIGMGKNIGGGGAFLRFASQAAGSPGTVTINDKAGTGPATINIADNSGTGTGGAAVGTLDLRGHVATVSVDTLTMGTQDNTTATGSPTGATGNVLFDAGTFTVDTITMAPKTAAGIATANATIGVGGGTFTVNTGITMGSQATAGLAAATLNISGGTFTSTPNIVKGTGAVTATINLSGGTLNTTSSNIGTAAAPIILNFTGGTLQNLAQLNGGMAVTKTGAGSATLSGTNAYTGATLVHQGVLTAASNSALGSGTNVSGSAPIGNFVQQWLAGTNNDANTEMSQESGTSNAAPGSATARDDDWYFAGTYPAPIGIVAANEALGGGPATGFERALTQADPTDRIHFNLAAAEVDDNFQLLLDIISSDFTGGNIPIQVLVNGVTVHTATISANTPVLTPVFAGTTVNMTTGDNVVTIQRTVGTGTGAHVQFDFIRLNRQTAIPAVNTQVESGATLVFTGGITSPESLAVNGTGAAGQGGAIVSSAGANTVSGAVSLLGNTTINVTAGSLALNGIVSGAPTLTKAGPNTLTLAAANTYTGATTVAGGTLAVTGSLVSAPTVQTGGTLTGTGSTGVLTVDVGGTHAPGTNVGTGTVNGNYVENGALQIEIGSPSGSVAGTDYDQVKVLSSGSVNIGAGATLAVTYTGAPGTFNPAVGTTYVIIDNDGATAADTVGTFFGLAEGAPVFVGGKALVIHYHGGDGNDVVLVAGATVLYVNDQFTGTPGVTIVDGDLETPGSQDALFGVTAFASIDAALTANAGFTGAIVVNGGTYAAASLAGGGNVTLRLVQDGVSEPNVVIGDLSGDAGDAIITRFNNVANGNVTIAQGAFSGVISGAGSVTKSTGGLLDLLGTNTYTGATNLSAGTLRVTGSTATSATTVQSGATLTGAGTNGAVTVNAGGVQLPAVGTAVGFANVTGNYVQNGGLTIEISSVGGTLAGTDYDQVRVTGSSSVTLGATSTLTVNYTGAPGTFNPATGAVYRIIDNAGTTTSGAFSGLPAGTLINVEGRDLQIQYNGGSGNDVVLVAQAPNIVLYVDDDFPAAGTVDGDLETAGPQNAVMGTSAFQSVAAALAANPGYTGFIVVNGGVYTGGALLAGGGDVTLRLVRDLRPGAEEFDVTFNDLSGDAGDQIVTRYHNAANANLIVTSGAFGGVISGTGDVIKNTSGTVTLSGANSYSGLTDVQVGVLTIANASALGSNAGGTTVASGAQLQLSGGIVITTESVTIAGQGVGSVGALNNLSGNNEWAGPIVIATGGNNRVGSSAGNLTLSGPISGGQVGALGGLTVRNGAGTTIVSGGANAYLGDTTVVVGTLRLAGGANRLPVGTKIGIGNGAGVSPAIFDLGGQNQTVAGLYTVVPSSTMVMEVMNSGSAATLTVDVTTGTDTYGGVITGAVNLVKSGAGVLELTSVGGNTANTYTGTTLVSGGRLHLNKPAGQNAIPGTLNITTGGLVSFGANEQIANTASVSVSDAASVFNGTGFNGGQLPNLQETIANLTVTGGTFQTGSGSNLNVTGTGSFTGGAGNTIFLGNSGSAITFGGLMLNAMNATPGGTVQTSNSFAIYGGGPAVGTVTVGSGGLLLSGSVFNLRQGTAGSRLVLNGDVTATGTSSIIVDPGSGSGGIAQVELSSTAGAANRSFDVTAGGTLTVSAIIADGAATPGSLTKPGVGTLVLSGANTYTGTTNVSAGVLQVQGGAAILDTAGAVNVGLGGTLQLLANETVSSYVGAGDTVGTNDGALALGAFTLTTTGSAAVADVTGSAGAAIVAGGSITDADDDNNITSPNIALTAATGIGSSGNPLETTVASFEASGGTGGVFLVNTGDLAIGGIGALVGVSATGGGINVSTTDNLTMNENVTGGADVTLSAGDNATLTSNVSSGTTITINIDSGDADAGTGGVFTLTGTLTAPGGATLNGAADNDTFNLRPQTAAAVTVNGFDPQMTTTGDILNLDLTGAVNQQLALGSIGSGVWTFNAPLQSVSYTSIEEMNANAPYHLTLNANSAAYGNTGVPDLITIRQSGANLIVERTGAPTAPDNDDVGVIFQGSIASIQSFTYIGSGDADILTVSDAGGLPQFASTVPSIPDNANLAGAGSILFDGNGGADDVVFNLTGANASLMYAIGSGSGAAGTEGEVRVTSGALALQAYVVDTELIERTGTGATPGAISILGDSGANAIAVTGSGANTSVSATGYTALNFLSSSFSAISIDGLANADTIELISLGTGSPPVTLTGGLGDDTLRVHSTSGNTGTVTLNGNLGSDHFILQSATNTVDGIVGPVIVDGSDGIVGGNDDRLTIVDSGDTTGDMVLVNAVSPATSSDYRVEGITSTGGDDVIFRNIDTLSYTGTAGNDTIDARFENTNPAHDLAVATLNGWTGGDQFLLFTSDQIGGTGPTPSGTPSGLASISLNGDAPGNPNALDGNDIFGQLPPGIIGTGNPGLAVADSVRSIRPSASTAIAINGGQPTAPVGTPGDSVGDVLNLDTSGLPSTSSLVLATLSGQLAGAGIEPLNYGQIEDLNYITNNQLINLQLGDTLVRATSGPDTVIFSRNPTPAMPNGVRVRLNTLVVDFPMNGKTLTEAGAGNDYVTHSNVTFPMEIHGEDGNDMLFGGTGNDLLIGGLGNDQINASAGDNILFGDNAPTTADPAPQNSTVGGNDILSSLGGADVHYGGGGDDQVSPGPGNDYLYGGEGDDILDGFAGDDRLYGGGGNDVISGSEGHDLLSGGAGNDLLFGRDGNDVLIGGDGVDSLDGGSGDDLLIGANVANQLSTWTSTTNGTTFDSSVYQRATDNDAALLALLAAWSSTGNRVTLAAVTDDGRLDVIYGSTGNDDFKATAGEAQDQGSPLMGSDESF